MLREIFGKKIGMTQIFDNEGNLWGVTLIEVEPVCVLEKIAYPTKTNLAKIGCFKWEEKKIDRLAKPLKGYFDKIGVYPYKVIREVVTEKEPEVKKEIGVEIFNEGDIVDVRAKTKGRGFAGGIKRHGWHGGPKTHGSMTHRRIGSNGSNTDPGRVVKGHRMPGHMGCAFRTIKSLKILRIDKEKQLLFIRGAVPGSKGSIVEVKKI
jgi:large subunit ribosomal protein L3